MIKHLLMSAVLLFPTIVSAESCFPLYEKEEKAIDDKDGYKTHVGGHLYVGMGGQLGYNPGLEVSADIDNWAEDLVEAVKYGPYMYFARPDDPRKAWLEAFRKAVKSECDLAQGEYTELRSMLKTLMEDGSFCPGNQILKPGMLGNKGVFKKVLVNAVRDQRFPEYCHSKAVKDDSNREVKDTTVGEKKSSSQSKASKQ